MLIKEGSKEKDIIREVQKVVNVYPDGIYGPNTEKAVINWQLKNNLVADGIVGPDTMEAMNLIDTDLSNNYLVTEDGLKIHKYFLPKGEYHKGPVNKDYVFIHHTAGWHNPFSTIDGWGRDSRGAVGTEFVIGGEKITGDSDNYSGQVLQAFPENAYAYHLGRTGSSYMNTRSTGVELCNFGYLKNGRTYTGHKVDESQIVTLDEPFKGYDQWHKYSNCQLESLAKLLQFIGDRDNIDIREGLPAWIRKEGVEKAFEFHQDAYQGKVKGLLTHTNVRKDKSDNFPQEELVDMLLSL